MTGWEFNEAMPPQTGATRTYPSREAGLIGPQISLAESDMLEAVLSSECARRGLPSNGSDALHLERRVRYAYSVGMNKEADLKIFIRNLTD